MLKDGTDPSYIYNTMPNDMTLYEELKDKYSNYTNLILNLSKYQKNEYKGMYDYQKKYESVG